jgi:hypothetical protein
MLFSAGQKLLFIEDSITSTSCTDGQRSLDDVYVLMLKNLLAAAHPELRLPAVNLSVIGNTTRYLKRYRQINLLDQIPDWLTIGFNFRLARPNSDFERSAQVLHTPLTTVCSVIRKITLRAVELLINFFGKLLQFLARCEPVKFELVIGGYS